MYLGPKPFTALQSRSSALKSRIWRIQAGVEIGEMECDQPPTWGTLTTSSDGSKPGDGSASKRWLCEAKTKGRLRGPVGSRTVGECPGSFKERSLDLQIIAVASGGLLCSLLLLSYTDSNNVLKELRRDGEGNCQPARSGAGRRECRPAGGWGRRPVRDLAPTEQPRKTSPSTTTNNKQKTKTASTFKDLTYLLHFNVVLQRDPQRDETFLSS